jgi:hypothetical protein
VTLNKLQEAATASSTYIFMLLRYSKYGKKKKDADRIILK